MTSPYTLARLAWRGWQRVTARPHIKHLHAACQHPESLAKKVSQRAGESSLQLGDGEWEWEWVKRGLLYGNGYWCCCCFSSSGPLKAHSSVEYHNKSLLGTSEAGWPGVPRSAEILSGILAGVTLAFFFYANTQLWCISVAEVTEAHILFRIL